MMEAATRTVFYSYLYAFAVAAGTILVGWLCGGAVRRCWNPPPPYLIAVLQSIAAGILLAATIGLVGWEIQTIGGRTWAEGFNRCILKILYVGCRPPTSARSATATGYAGQPSRWGRMPLEIATDESVVGGVEVEGGPPGVGPRSASRR